MTTIDVRISMDRTGDVETSAPDRRFDYVPAPRQRVIRMRPTWGTANIQTSAIDLRDDILRDEVPSIVGDTCHGTSESDDAIVQAIAEEDTKPVRRVATGTTPPAVHDELAADDPLTLVLARGSAPRIPMTMSRRGDGER